MKSFSLRKLNIQEFAATDLNPTYTLEGFDTVEQAHEYYEKMLKEYVYDESGVDNYFENITIPKNSGKSVTLRQLLRYKATMQARIEGVTPTEDDPMQIVEYKLSTQDYHGYTTYSDEHNIYSINDGWIQRIHRNQISNLKEELQKKYRDCLWSSTNRYFAGVTVQSTDTLASIRANVTQFNLSDLLKISVMFQRMDVKPDDDGYYVALVSPEVASDIMTLTKSSTEYTWFDIAKYDPKTALAGEIGRVLNFKIVQNKLITEIDKTYNVHGCIFLGKYQNEWGATKTALAGHSEPEVIIKDVTSGGARENPTNQIGSIAWVLRGLGMTVVNPEAVLIYECKSSAVIDKWSPLNKPNYVRGSDGKGNSLDSSAETTINANGITLSTDVKTVTIKQASVGKSSSAVAKYYVQSGVTVEDVATTYQTNFGLDSTVTLYTDVAKTTAATTTDTITADTVFYI